MDKNSLNRFLDAQARMYETALAEIKNGRKCSHWIWFIFPQLRGLGRSEMADYYGISGLEEALAYLAHPVLSARLLAISKALLLHRKKRITAILGYTDAMKLCSCMTLFAALSDGDSVFRQVLDAFYDGKEDILTLKMLRSQ